MLVRSIAPLGGFLISFETGGMIHKKYANRGSHMKEEWHTLWLFNMAMENGPFIDDFPS